MSESIFTLYKDEKFEKIRYYLKEQGIVTLADLMRFDFNELLFVPGIPEHLISEAKHLLSLHEKSPLNNNEASDIVHPVYEETLASLENTDIEATEIEANIYDNPLSQTAYVKDALITEVYYNVPRSAPFINKCISDGKSLMSHLTDTDFDEAVNLKGLGIASVENLRKIYTKFINTNSHSGGYFKKNESPYYSNAIDYFPLSVRAKNCLKTAGISSLEELLSLSEEDLMKIKNMGAKTCKEILTFCETASFLKTDPSMLYNLEKILPENMPIPIPLLRNIGVSEQGINLFLKKGCLTIGDLCNQGLNMHEYSFARNVNEYMSIPVSEHFINAVEALKDRAKLIIKRRCNGATLEQIGKELKVTRERVRQIIAKTCRQLIGYSELVAGVLLSTDKSAFSFSDLSQLFPTEEEAMYCKLVLQESDYVQYLKFADKFVCAAICEDNIEDRLKGFTEEIICEGINFYDNLELIETGLEKQNLGYLDIEDIMNFLIHNRYRFYGDFVTKGKQSYAIVCYDAVRKFFKLDIKLDSDEGNEDMLALRQIIDKHYQGLSLPPGNRALTAGMTRDASKLILSGRGRYCPIDKVIFNIRLFEEVHNFIQNSPQNTFYYAELFSNFQGRFLAETNINNPYFLHGMLKYLYPDDFKYERDLMTKIGELRRNVDDRLSQLLLENGRSMTRAEIKQAIPGLNDYVISFSAIRLPEVIQWDYNEFNHIGNIDITHEERIILFNAIKTETQLHNGYASDTLLYNAGKGICKNFFSRNNINNTQNLFYIASCLFEGDFRFRRPHILSKDFPVKDITLANIVRVLLQYETELNYEKYFRLAAEIGWAEGTAYHVFSDLEKDFIRVSENEYIRKDFFVITQAFINSLSDVLHELVSNSGYFAFCSIFDYEVFPKCAYKWNGFLLESLITEYNTGFRIIYPQIRDRRYQRGIIIPYNSPYKSFEDLILGTFISDGISVLSETELLKYLKMRGLITTRTIPQELYDCPRMPFKNEVFTIK